MTLTRPDSSTVVTQYSFDVLNRLSTTTSAEGITRYTYDAVGNRKSVSYPNGTQQQYHYDSLNRLVTLDTYSALNVLLQRYSYTLHATGRRTDITELDGRSTHYTYDSAYRLTGEQITDPVNGSYEASYQYDKVGNRVYETKAGVSTAYSYDDNDRLTQTGGKTFSYDNNGSTLSETLDGETTHYRYNAQNQLVETTQAGVTTQYHYNADGIRTGQGNGTTQTHYVVDQNRDYAQVLLETQGTSAVVYTYGDDLISQSRAGVASYYHYDGLGSTRALSDGLGAVTDTYHYEAFGDVLHQTGVTENSYLFAGEQFDNNLNQYYLRARYYNQATGRFTQQDTWMGNNHDPVTLHKYLYANADPVMYTDPSGNFSMGQLSTALNVMGTLANIALTTYDVFQIATGEEGFSAKDIGLTILMSRLPVKAAARFFRKGCSKNSFDGATLVSTASGLTAIKNIKIGDLVWAYSESEDDSILQPVIHLIKGEGLKSLIEIHLVSGEVITSTEGHPFFVFDNKQWVDAGDLKAGDRLMRLGGAYVSIDRIEIIKQEVTVYNLTVANDHNYYVGEDTVLVHNIECDIGGKLVQLGKLDKLDDKYMKKLGIDAHAAKKLITGSTKRNARFDLLVDKDTRRVLLKQKDGTLSDGLYTLDELILEAPIRRR